MATDEGWRSRMEEQATELRRRMRQAPAQVVYVEGKSPPPNGEPGGHERWFHREFGAERALARAALQAFRETQAEIERSEETEDQREARNAHLRNWRKGSQTSGARPRPCRNAHAGPPILSSTEPLTNGTSCAAGTNATRNAAQLTQRPQRRIEPN